MTTWTKAAKAELQTYFDRIEPGLSTCGADPKEVTEDLRRHLDAEVAAAGLRVVTEQDVRRLLAKIGAPPIPESPSNPAAQSATARKSAPALMGGFASVTLLLMGVVLPLVTLAIESLTRMCEAAFFNPLPTIWHGLLVAFVPLANALVWNAVRDGQSRYKRQLGWINGASIAIAAFYSFLFIPLLLPGAFAIILFGWGLLPWSPMLSLIAAVILRVKLRRAGPGTASVLPGFWRGFALGLLALALTEAPVFLTRTGMQMAVSESRTTQNAGIGWLRRVGKDDILLRACYGFTRGAQNMDMRGMLISGGQRISAEQAREIYYRVTGVPFNSVPPPAVRTGRGVWNELNDWTWDEDHGGDKVGGRIRGLKLNSSRIDAIIDSDAAWSYTEWTMEFRNDSAVQREARTQIQLPPGGVVSRLTLWVNGEEREAAFAGRSHVREAYQKVAVQQRRDPVLVTTSGPDRILMQCFPVPAGGGLMKVRIGVTAPLTLPALGEGIVRLPMILERNFNIPEDVEHSVWVQGNDSMATASELAKTVSPDGSCALRGQLSNAELASPDSIIQLQRDRLIRHAWTPDTRGNRNGFIRQSISETSTIAPQRLVIVVDGSRTMRPYMSEISGALRDLPDSLPVTVLAASDVVTVVSSPSLTRGVSANAADAVQSINLTGGQDNVPALIQAWEDASKEPGAVIVWLHCPQPMLFSSAETLVQALERTPQGPTIFELQAGTGPDRVIEKLNGSPAIHSLPRLGSLCEDLTRLFASWKDGAQIVEFIRERVESEATARADAAVETSLQLARLWAFDEVRQLQARREISGAVQLAGLYQLVTPVSGAVVLENKQQYQATGLQPVDPQTVPAIPEPTTVTLLLMGMLSAWFWRRTQMR